MGELREWEQNLAGDFLGSTSKIEKGKTFDLIDIIMNLTQFITYIDTIIICIKSFQKCYV